MKLLFATGNSFKLDLMKKRLSVFEDLEIISPKDLGINIDVLEDGTTAEENAIKKATAYFEVAKIPTIAEDSGLYIDKFSKEEQPGLFVKRVNGVEGLPDEEVFNYYYNKIASYGGASNAHYFTGVAIVDEDGIVHSATLHENDFILTTNIKKENSLKGGILEPMSIDPVSGKYFDERTPEEVEQHYKELNEKYRELIKQYVIKSLTK